MLIQCKQCKITICTDNYIDELFTFFFRNLQEPSPDDVASDLG